MAKSLQKKSFGRRILWAALVLAIVLIAARYAILRVYNVNFYPTNGDFQTYNVLRRFLAGQMPYQDFANYLGMGVLFLNAPLLLFHNTFAGSLFVSHFTVGLLFSLIVFVVFYLVCGNKIVSAFAALFSQQLVHSLVLLSVPMFGSTLQTWLEMLAKPQNSMRTTRLFLPFLYILLFLGWAKVYGKKHGKPFDVQEQLKKPLFCGVCGALVGAGIVWSNDYGFACIGSATVIFIALLMRQHYKRLRRIFKPLGIYLAALLGGAGVVVMLCTGFHPGAYFRQAAGVAEYQFWYYGVQPDKIYSFADLLHQPDFLFYTAALVGVLVWCIVRLVRGRLGNRSLMLGFLYASLYIAALIYIYGSGDFSFKEGLNGFALLAVFALLCRGVLWLFGKLKNPGKLRKIMAGGLAIVTCAYCLFSVYAVAAAATGLPVAIEESQQYYVPQLDGVTRYASELELQQQLVEDEQVFSTYATALDVVNGQFQPTGSDYIIHALGTAQQAEYVQIFLSGNYSFVQTLNHNKEWEPWAVRQNWEFYRLLYRDYQPKLETDNWCIWQKNEDGAFNLVDAAAQVDVIQQNESDTEFVVTTAYKNPCIVEIEVTYHSGFVFNAYRLQTWRQAVQADDGMLPTQSGGSHSCYFLPSGQQTRRIPVWVENGQGRLLLSSQPTQCTALQIDSAVPGMVLAMPNFPSVQEPVSL